jgi:hypothetical protein
MACSARSVARNAFVGAGAHAFQVVSWLLCSGQSALAVVTPEGACCLDLYHLFTMGQVPPECVLAILAAWSQNGFSLKSDIDTRTPHPSECETAQLRGVTQWPGSRVALESTFTAPGGSASVSRASTWGPAMLLARQRSRSTAAFCRGLPMPGLHGRLSSVMLR